MSQLINDSLTLRKLRRWKLKTLLSEAGMKILCLGEVLIDMLSQGAAPKDGNIPSMKPFQPYAGGAPANVAVAVAQLGGKSAMVSKVGDDTFGAF